MHGGKGGHRLLEDHGDLVAPDRAHLFAVRIQAADIDRLAAPVRQRSRPHDARLGHDPEDRLGGDGLAAARFADHSQDVVLPVDVERDAVHGLEHAFIQWKCVRRLRHLEQQIGFRYRRLIVTHLGLLYHRAPLLVRVGSIAQAIADKVKEPEP